MLYYYSYVTDTEEMPLGVSSTDLDMVRSWAKKTVKQLGQKDRQAAGNDRRLVSGHDPRRG